MAESNVGTANNFSLSGGTIDGMIAIQSFDGLEINVELVADKGIGCQGTGDTLAQPQPGGKTFGTPTFASPIEKGNKGLWDWWEKWFPLEGGQRTASDYEEITFVFRNNNEVLASWVLKGAWPSKYEISSASIDESGLATETITVACREIVRRE